MEKLVRDFLSEHFDQIFCSKIQFSPIPKGQTGDLAMSFFELTKACPGLDPGTKKSPPQIASEVAEALKGCPLLEKTEITGPYLNLFFEPKAFFESVFAAPLKSETLKDQSIVIEFSGPNTNKPLHLGHMRNHALGISVSNLLEACGAKVYRVNIINDRGVHICKSMLAYEKFGNGETPESVGKKSDHFVGDWYVRFEQELKKDESLKDEIPEMLNKWESGDEAVQKLWKKMNTWALAGHQVTYRRQGIKFEKEYFESEHYSHGKEIAEAGLKKKVFHKRDDGAVVIDLTDEEKLDDEKVILRSDGTSIYLTNDLAVAVARDKDFHPDQLIYVVADEQNYHFRVLFICLERLGLLPREKCHHLSYGLVHLPHGRMKSREGTIVDADNLMDELANLAKQEIQKRNPELSETEKNQAAEQIMNAAWKFFILTTSPRKSITFDPEKSIAFEGATGPYLQYAGVRIKSIFRKAGGTSSGDFSEFLGEVEKPLGVKILEFNKVLDRAAETLNPTFVVTYLLELAQEWSSFYAENSVLKAETDELKNARLQLAQKVFEVLETGLKILGIEIPKQM